MACFSIIVLHMTMSCVMSVFAWSASQFPMRISTALRMNLAASRRFERDRRKD